MDSVYHGKEHRQNCQRNFEWREYPNITGEEPNQAKSILYIQGKPRINENKEFICDAF
jgi:hypothetical protein